MLDRKKAQVRSEGQRLAWIVSCYFLQSRIPLFTKHRNTIPLEQSMHLQLGFGLVYFGFWSLEYLSTSIDVHSLPSLDTAIWSVKLLNPLHCVPRHSLFFFKFCQLS